MGEKTTFTVSGWVERHYRIEVEAESYDEAERKGYDTINCSEPSDLYDYNNGTHIIMGDVECEDPDWEEDDNAEDEKEKNNEG